VRIWRGAGSTGGEERYCVVCSFVAILFQSRRVNEALTFRVATRTGSESRYLRDGALLPLLAVLAVAFQEVAAASSGGISCGRLWSGRVRPNKFPFRR